MNTSLKINRWIVGGALAVIAAVVLVACGGGGQESSTSDTRETPLASSGGPTIAWTPASIDYTANPGSRQSFPVAFTASADLSDVTISVVPELSRMVAVSPSSFPSLLRGQVATVTITVSPSSAEALRTVEGTIHARVGRATRAKPLPVKVALIAPEVINGITVPPEPSAELNNATLAGFDANGNGVRDDVERVMAARFGGTADYPFAMAYARQYQAEITAPTPTQRSDALVQVGREVCATEGASYALRNMDMSSLMETTQARKQAIRALNDVLVGYIAQELPSCAN